MQIEKGTNMKALPMAIFYKDGRFDTAICRCIGLELDPE